MACRQARCEIPEESLGTRVCLAGTDHDALYDEKYFAQCLEHFSWPLVGFLQCNAAVGAGRRRDGEGM